MADKAGQRCQATKAIPPWIAEMGKRESRDDGSTEINAGSWEKSAQTQLWIEWSASCVRKRCNAIVSSAYQRTISIFIRDGNNMILIKLRCALRTPPRKEKFKRTNENVCESNGEPLRRWIWKKKTQAKVMENYVQYFSFHVKRNVYSVHLLISVAMRSTHSDHHHQCNRSVVL